MHQMGYHYGEHCFYFLSGQTTLSCLYKVKNAYLSISCYFNFLYIEILVFLSMVCFYILKILDCFQNRVLSHSELPVVVLKFKIMFKC